MNEEVGVAVVGYGFMGTTHLTAWSMVPDARVLALVGRDRGKAGEVARRHRVASLTSLEEALREPSINAVDICTPTFTHRDYALEALNAGKHVLVEKPMALSLKEADEMIEAAEAQGLRLMVAHVLRFFSEYAKAKGLIEAGAIGHPIQAWARRAGPMPPWGSQSWFMDQSRSGGVAVDLAIHDVDFLRWCLQDEVERVYALTHRRAAGQTFVDDHALLLLSFRDGATAHVEASWAMPSAAPFTTSLEINGTSGRLCVDNQSTAPLAITNKDGAQRFSPEERPWVQGMPFPVDPFCRELQHFSDCLRESRTPTTDGRESRRSLEVVLAAVESATRKEPIDLSAEA